MSINIPTLKKDKNDAENFSLMNPFAKTKISNLSENSLNDTIVNPAEADADVIFKESDYTAPQRHSLSSENPFIHKITDPNNTIVEKSLKTSVIFESSLSLSYLKTKFSDTNFLIQKMKNLGNDNLSYYYRYPDTALPSTQKKYIHKALSSNLAKLNKNDQNLMWYKMFSEKWRKALLSAHETLKYGLIDCFYFVQENLTVLFERDANDFILKAYMQLTSLALAEDLKHNGQI